MNRVLLALSFPRRRESILGTCKRNWIPAYAGMTKKAGILP
jgi:hypothetical protein